VRWLADECVAAPLVARMRVAGQDTLYVGEITPGASDRDIMGLAEREDRLLLTEDKDFGEMVFLWRRPMPGIVLLRIDHGTELQWRRLESAIGRLGDMMLGRYTVIEPARFRSRPLMPLSTSGRR
jgi:predicted nuclease of predicted toxin-antitoxin system